MNFKFLVTKKDEPIAGFQKYEDAHLFFQLLSKERKDTDFFIEIAIYEFKNEKYLKINSFLNKQKAG